MIISKDIPFVSLLSEIIEEDRAMGAGSKYLDFLCKVYMACYRDKDFAAGLEAAVMFCMGDCPTVEKVERTLARMDGGIRPLLEEKGIVEPRPKVEG